MNSRNRSSFTAADEMPVKLLQDITAIHSIVGNGVVPPLHPQILPTNKCNLKCEFCSCSNEDKKLEIPIDELTAILHKFCKLGMKGVTITGGGEPLLYKDFGKLITYLHNTFTKIGLVTNGTLLSTVDKAIINKITWCRISHSDYREFEADYANYLKMTILEGSDVDWAFSYVLSQQLNIDNLRKLIEFANEYEFTHVRVVNDILAPDGQLMVYVERELADTGIDLSRVIFQPRANPVRGHSKCRIGLLKPLVGADGKLYACCGVQYAFNKPSRNLPPELCLGKASDIEQVIKTGAPVDGTICDRCYYTSYNQILDKLITPLEHKEFV